MFSSGDNPSQPFSPNSFFIGERDLFDEGNGVSFSGLSLYRE